MELHLGSDLRPIANLALPVGQITDALGAKLLQSHVWTLLPQRKREREGHIRSSLSTGHTSPLLAREKARAGKYTFSLSLSLFATCEAHAQGEPGASAPAPQIPHPQPTHRRPRNKFFTPELVTAVIRVYQLLLVDHTQPYQEFAVRVEALCHGMYVRMYMWSGTVMLSRSMPVWIQTHADAYTSTGERHATGP
jgi:hypothetical protein